jgi:hypothetical protein
MKAPRVGKWVGLGVAGLLIAIVFLNLALRSWHKVASDCGLETFYNAYGMELNHLIVLVSLFVVLPIALIIGFGIQWWEWWKERDFKSNSGTKK